MGGSHCKQGCERLSRTIDLSDKDWDSDSSDDSGEEEGRAAVPVTVHVYDVTGSGAVVHANSLLEMLGTGAYHVGVEVFGVEWSYGKASACGIFQGLPGACRMHRYREPVHMGTTTLRRQEVQQLIKAMEPAWPGMAYELFHRNCTHFCDDLCRRLGVRPLPRWLSSLGAAGDVLGEVAEEVLHPFQASLARAHRLQRDAAALSLAGKARRGADAAAPAQLGDELRGLVAYARREQGEAPQSEAHLGDLARGVVAAVHLHYDQKREERAKAEAERLAELASKARETEARRALHRAARALEAQ